MIMFLVNYQVIANSIIKENNFSSNIDWVIVLPIFISIISLLISIKKYNIEKNINRPYIIISKDIKLDPLELKDNEEKKILFIKNIGHTYANIINIETKPRDADDLSFIDIILAMEHLKGSIFKPNEEVKLEYNKYSTNENLYTFKIKYKGVTKKVYKDTIIIDIN